MKLRIAGAQIPVTNDIPTNIATLRRAIDFATAEKADILLTPEGSLSGYRPHFDVEEVEAALDDIVGYAKEGGIALALGTCFVEPSDGLCYNQIRFYTKESAFLGFHSKILRCGTMTQPTQGEINDYATTPLRMFDINGVSAGGLICNDLWANPMCTPMPDPHLTQQHAELGTQVIFHAVNGGRDGSPLSKVFWNLHESNLRVRAMSGRLWIVTVDNCAPTNLPCSAPSGILNPKGEWAVKADPVGEQYFAYTVDL